MSTESEIEEVKQICITGATRGIEDYFAANPDLNGVLEVDGDQIRVTCDTDEGRTTIVWSLEVGAAAELDPAETGPDAEAGGDAAEAHANASEQNAGVPEGTPA